MMTDCDFTSALAQLLTKPALRETFYADPAMAADLIGIRAVDRALFVTLLAEQVRRQAQLLITKRMRAVFEQLPVTVSGLGNLAAHYFNNYASQYWPGTYRRHLIDALHFCRYLNNHGLPCNRSEFNRLRFQYAGRRLRFCLTKDAMVDGNVQWALQVLYQLRGRQAEWRLYFKFR